MKNFVLTLAISGLLAGSAWSQVPSTTDRTNQRGDAIHTDRNIQNGQGTVDKTITGPNGNTATVDKSINGNGTVDKTVTGPNGKTATVDKTYTGTGTVDKTVTGPNGRTYNSSVTRGPVGVEKTQTGPNGRTRTVQRRRARVR